LQQNTSRAALRREYARREREGERPGGTKGVREARSHQGRAALRECGAINVGLIQRERPGAIKAEA